VAKIRSDRLKLDKQMAELTENLSRLQDLDK
jgi:hypothetical protein